MDIEQSLDQHAHTAAESIRRINHLTIHGPALPAPNVYTILVPLEQLGYGLQQALHQISRALDRSPAVYQIYEDNPARDPDQSIAEARRQLAAAAHLAGMVGQFLGHARDAIAGQGYHNPTPDPPDASREDH
jgi:hypothetical protein